MKAVQCITQHEWDFVNDKLRSKDLNLPSNYWDTYKEFTCKNLERKTYGDVPCYKDDKIYSFNEWCIENNYPIETKEEIIEERIDEDLSYLKVLFKRLKIK